MVAFLFLFSIDLFPHCLNFFIYLVIFQSKGMTGTVGDRTIVITKSALDNKGSLKIFSPDGINYVIRYNNN